MSTEVFIFLTTFLTTLFFCFIVFYSFYIKNVINKRKKDHAYCGGGRIENPYSNTLMFNLTHSGTSVENTMESFYKMKREDSEEFLEKVVEYYRKYNHLLS
jgi:hypothetical protein